jgi:hypothetical protein
MTPMTNMTKLLKSALLLTALATMAGCTVVPPQMAYTGPRVEVVRPAPYPYYPPASYQPRIEIVRPVPYPYYQAAPYGYYEPRREHRRHRDWDRDRD